VLPELPDEEVVNLRLDPGLVSQNDEKSFGSRVQGLQALTDRGYHSLPIVRIQNQFDPGGGNFSSNPLCFVPQDQDDFIHLRLANPVQDMLQKGLSAHVEQLLGLAHALGLAGSQNDGRDKHVHPLKSDVPELFHGSLGLFDSGKHEFQFPLWGFLLSWIISATIFPDRKHRESANGAFQAKSPTA